MITSDEKVSWKECYLCHDKSLKVFYQAKDIFKCNKCNFVFYKPIPSKQELNEVYSGYTREDSITEISKVKIKKEFSKVIC